MRVDCGLNEARAGSRFPTGREARSPFSHTLGSFEDLSSMDGFFLRVFDLLPFSLTRRLGGFKNAVAVQ
jgi:hypothetical protein